MRRSPSPLLPVLTLAFAAAAGCGRSSESADRSADAANEANAAPAPVEGALSAQGDLPTVTLASLRGAPAMFLVEGRESMEKQQSKSLKNALDRWEYPGDLKAFVVADGRPYRLIPGLKNMASQFLDAMRPELRLPMYADFQGEVLDPLGVESGAFELVVLDAEGMVAHRHRGDASPEDIEKIREVLGAREPAAPPTAKPFRLGEIDNAACTAHGCVFVFLGEAVQRNEIPGIEPGGFEGDREDAFAQLKKAPVRVLAQVATRWDYEKTPVRGAIVGDGPSDLLPSWQHLPAASEAREAFGLSADSTALVTVDTQGRVAFLAEGSFPFWKLSQARQSVGLSDLPWKR
ncbi:MAG: TlpA family protein disulfide reductase [Nannocystaceae bacterium]